MLNRLFASLGLVLAAFAATTGVSSAAIDDRSEVMYVTAAAVVVLLVVVSIAAAVKHSLGLDKMAPPAPDEAHGHHGAGDHAADDGHDGAPAAQGSHH